MKHVLSFFLMSSLSLPLFSSDEALLEIRGLFKIADENSKHLHKERKNNALLSRKSRTQRRQQARDDKDFRQGNLSANHSLNVSYLQEVSRSSKA